MYKRKIDATWVIKLGGSLCYSEHLPDWLQALSDTHAVVVPGGGPFADQVRTAQNFWKFSEEAAHIMALLAMAQYGWMLFGMCPLFHTVSDINILQYHMIKREPTLWVPDPYRLSYSELLPSWEVTSDSIAAWIRGKLGADHLLLIKSCLLPKVPVPVQYCVQQGWVDSAFPTYLTVSGNKAWLCHSDKVHHFREGLHDPDKWFTPIV